MAMNWSTAAAAVLLVAALAMLAAHPCDAHSFNITNGCNKTITLSTGAGNYSITAGATVNITTPPAMFFTGIVNVTIPAINVPIHVGIPGGIVLFLDKLSGLQKLVIKCSGSSCVSLTVTFVILPWLPDITVALGQICPLTLPPLPSLPPIPSVSLPPLSLPSLPPLPVVSLPPIP